MLTRLGIIGLGLIGGSLALALKRAFPDVYIMAMEVDGGVVDWATTHGMVDEWVHGHDGFRACDWVILASPTPTIPHHLWALNSIQGSSYILSDVSSVKSPILNACRDTQWRYPMVWMHPMAGKEVGGIQHADGRLLVNRPMLIMGDEGLAMTKVSNWVAKLPMTVVPMGLKEHDDVVGVASHWPYLMAMLTVRVAKKMGVAGLSDVVSSGFYDTTRVAASSADWGMGILTANQAVLRQAIHVLRQELMVLESDGGLSELQSDALKNWIKEGRDYRNGLFPIAPI